MAPYHYLYSCIAAASCGVALLYVSKYSVSSIHPLVVQNGENQDSGRQLGLFFINASDAAQLVERIAENDARLAKDASISEISMEVAIDLFNRANKDDELKGVSFRLMPDLKQVENAMELYKQAGVPVKRLIGIPVFQAEGLTISADSKKFTPIFLAKEDLDAALGSAHTRRNTTQAQQYLKKAESLTIEYEAAQKTYEESTDNRSKRKAKDKADKAYAGAQELKAKARKADGAGLPKIEVGVFEDVLAQMERDKAGDFARVMFIPPGAILGSEADGADNGSSEKQK